MDKDYYKNYLKRIEAVTAEDLLRVANKYMTPSNINIIVVGEASEVGPKLEKFGTLNYIDKEGNKVKAPGAMEIPEGVTNSTVINDYINAIGGAEKIKTIKTVVSKFGSKMQGMDIVMTSIFAEPHKSFSSMEVPAMGMVVQKEVFNGTKGYAEAQGQVMPTSAEDLKDNMVEQAVVPEMNYTEFKVVTKLTGIKDVNGSPAYEIETTMPSGSVSKVYYDMKSKLRVKQSVTQTTPRGDMTISSFYNNYKEVGGVKFPHTLEQVAGPQKIKMDATSIEVNVKVDESLFKVK